MINSFLMDRTLEVEISEVVVVTVAVVGTVMRGCSRMRSTAYATGTGLFC